MDERGARRLRDASPHGLTPTTGQTADPDGAPVGQPLGDGVTLTPPDKYMLA